MLDSDALVAEIEALPDGPGTGAFFDFDGTIIAGFSAFVFIREQVRRGDLSPAELLKLATAMSSFGLGNMGFSAMMLATMQFLRGMSEQSYEEFGEQLFRDHIARRVYPESRALVRAHQRKGHTVAIVSSATPYQVAPAARDLGIEHVLCTRLEVEDGKFTGGVIRPTCFGEGKVAAAKTLVASHGVSLANSYAYSDSYDDIELLECVGHPRALNPNARLERTAVARGWPVQRYTSRGRAGVGEWARSLAATGSLVASVAASLPIWALTGSRRKAQNFSYALFAETAGALIGMTLDIQGEGNLWLKRPAVFVFNHQSKADVIIMVSLLRRDIAGVGKKEIRNIPVIGQVMEFGGVVFIDRANSASAIDAMQPLLSAMRDDGRSVVIAPEGTRSVSPRLGPFKKGAFHLAMQAGVPIVPVVIHNAMDVAPKGEFVFRPATVKVEVLPPVDTSKWRAGTIDEHVAEVRGMFLAALGQAPAEVALAAQPPASAAVSPDAIPPLSSSAQASRSSKRKASAKTGARKTTTRTAATRKTTTRKVTAGKTTAKKKAAESGLAGKATIRKPPKQGSARTTTKAAKPTSAAKASTDEAYE